MLDKKVNITHSIVWLTKEIWLVPFLKIYSTKCEVSNVVGREASMLVLLVVGK